MKPIVTVSLIALSLVIVLGGLVFLNRKNNPAVSLPAVSENGPANQGATESNVLSVRKGLASKVSATGITVSGSEGEFGLSVSSETVFKDEKGNPASVSSFFDGLPVEVEEKGGRALLVKIVSRPAVIISSPKGGSLESGKLEFTILGKMIASYGTVSVSVKNRRTGTEYLTQSVSVTDSGNGYGSFSLPVELSIALDIIDGDAVDAHFSIKGTDNKIIEIFSAGWIYRGGAVSRIKVYFGKGKGSCRAVYPVERLVAASRSATRAVIEELIKGPTITERNQGYFTNIGSEVKIRSVEPKEDKTLVDFNDGIKKPVGGCPVSTSILQIEEGFKGNPIVKGLIITVNGDPL